MAEAGDMILPSLCEMRAENATSHAQTGARFASVEQGSQNLASSMSRFRHALTADSLLSKLVMGEFEERSEIRERKMRELEGRK